MTDNSIELLCRVLPEQREALCALYEKAGSLYNLLNMSSAALLSLGCDAQLCEKLPLFADIARSYFSEAEKTGAVILTPEAAAELLAPIFTGLNNEKLAVCYLSGRGEVIKITETDEGSSSGVDFSPGNCVREALRLHAKAVVLAHNHPHGYAVASRQDTVMTRDLSLLLKDIGVTLFTHIIFAGSSWCVCKTE